MLLKIENRINRNIQISENTTYGIVEVLEDKKDVRPCVVLNGAYCSMLPDDNLSHPMYSFIHISDGYNVLQEVFEGTVSVIFYGRTDRVGKAKREIQEEIINVGNSLFRNGFRLFSEPKNVYSGFTHNNKTQLINWNEHFCYKITGTFNLSC